MQIIDDDFSEIALLMLSFMIGIISLLFGIYSNNGIGFFFSILIFLLSLGFGLWIIGYYTDKMFSQENRE